MTAAPPEPVLEPTPRTTLRRKATRAEPSFEAMAAIFDEGVVCHVGIANEAGPVVTPMVYARIDRSLYLHGSTSNRTLTALVRGASVCVTVTLVDGLVLARSMFRHSMNYRSVMLFATAEVVTNSDEQCRAAAALIDHMVPGRSATVRPPSESELRSTTILRLPIAEASAKIRTGGPSDFPADLELGAWAGELPLRLTAGELRPDGPGMEDVSVPSHLDAIIGVPRGDWARKDEA